MDKDARSTEKFKIVDNALMIDDNYQTQIWLLRGIFILNLLNAFLQLLSRSFDFEITMSFFWLFFGLFSIIALLTGELILSASKSIELHKIDFLKIKSNLNGLTYSIKLKNGKIRRINLDYKNYFKELSDLKEICKTYQIPIIE
jgi:hypothetical protein